MNNQIKKFNPDLIAISSTEDMWELGMTVMEEIKEFKIDNDIPVVAGGVFCTFAPDICINYPLVDMVCVGEGEQAIVDLCERIEKGKEKLGYKNGVLVKRFDEKGKVVERCCLECREWFDNVEDWMGNDIRMEYYCKSCKTWH